MTAYKRIFIVGQPGAGKTLLAKTVAEKLGWQFIDADFGIEFHVGRILNEILGHEGSKSFMNCQFDILNTLLDKENIVVATDVSIVCSEKNRDLLAKEFSIFLQVGTTTQLARITRNPDSLLPVKDMKLFLDHLHQDRDQLFADIASLTIDSDDNDLEKHVANIIHILQSDNTLNTKKMVLEKKEVTLIHKKTHVPTHLSEQQAICLKLLSQGKSSKEIARDMHISHRTVEGHIKNMMELLGCDSSKELISLYFE